MKKFLRSISLVVLGFAFGIVFTGYLSMCASNSFLEIVRLNYRMEQQIKAIQAKKTGDIDSAIRYYKNLVSISSPPGLYSFNNASKIWTMFFPFHSLILKRIDKDVRNERAIKVDEGTYRAMLADALNKAGRIEEGNSNHIKAASLLGYGDDVARVKEFINEMNVSEGELLKLQNEFTYLQNTRKESLQSLSR